MAAQALRQDLRATDAAGAGQVITRLRQRLRHPSAPQAPALTCCVGAITSLEPPIDSGDAATLAEQLMYELKARGKNGMVYRSVGAGGDAGAPLPAAEASTPGSDLHV